jgi:Protein of unknown function (DUF2934)
MKHPLNETRRQPIQIQSPELDEKIRRRAYELYEQRGRTDGSDLEDWVQAETEVLAGHEMARTA